MAEDDPDTQRLNELERKLKQARGTREQESVPETRQSQLGIAFRLVTELVAGVVVGGAVGWALDRVLGTSPILLIVFFFAGTAAGFRNVLRTARELNRIGTDKD
jgi:ATP synthase protein I